MLAQLAVRDAYTFDLLEFGEAYSERELERAIIAPIEVGKKFGIRANESRNSSTGVSKSAS
ncbi:MAG: DUF1016 family protein [Desulfosarcina sp.]|nr:DUF1016 family protein [Desulfosarcina sp.]MBC2767562.1 DUF1016 domain-containing protein [Desulfosarcina sp.]